AGIQEFDLEMKVYPNPSSTGLMNVVTANNVAIETLTVFDITGRVVVQKQGLGNATELDLTAWNSGVYILKVETEQGAAVRRITVK
ncbi:MAG: T9SS type A sorting domain-containing protein, partial [Schleiferiaceae bacterium]